jgi:hypothetical protein
LQDSTVSSWIFAGAETWHFIPHPCHAMDEDGKMVEMAQHIIITILHMLIMVIQKTLMVKKLTKKYTSFIHVDLPTFAVTPFELLENPLGKGIITD